MTRLLTEADQMAACPFCGSTRLRFYSDSLPYVACIDCASHGPYVDVFRKGKSGSETEAIRLWNQRATEAEARKELSRGA